MPLETTSLVAVGNSALAANSTGFNNTAVGACALQGVSTGVGNVGIGYAAGSNITTGSRNIAIGHNAQVASATADDQVVIGNAATFSTTATTLNGTLAVTGNATLGGALIGSVQALTTVTGAGAVNVTTLTTKLTSTGTDALSLANGTEGQIKHIVMVVDGGDATLTPTTKTGFNNIKFTAVGQAVSLVYFTTLGWTVLANYGATIGAVDSAPTLVSAERLANTTVRVTLSEVCDTATITKANAGGFTVHEIGAPETAYAVSAIAPNGGNYDEIDLTVANMSASAAVGVTIKYAAGGNGTVADDNGNLMATDATGVNAAAWA